jgi:FtsH-binding integral membrane protein
MNYAMEQPIAIRASESARAAFIRRTYAHLAGAILAFICLETVLLQLPGIEEIVIRMISGHAWIIVFLMFMGVSWLANSWAHSNTSPGIQYMGLGLYTLAEAVIFLPLLYIAKTYYPQAITTAGILTLAMFAGLTLTVFITRKDFSFLGPILCLGSMLAFGFIIVSLLIGFSIGLVFSWAMVALISGYILFYTSSILHHYRTDQHVAAALALFSSIATLFWYILQIVMSSSRD